MESLVVLTPAHAAELDDAQSLHDRIVAAHHQVAEADAALARLLDACWQRRAYRALGFTTKADYCASFGLSYEKARVLARLGAHFEELPQLETAMRGGIGWTKLREVERVLVPENTDAWLAFAREQPQRVVADAVRLSDVGELPPPVDEVRRQVRVRKVFELAADQAELVERALVMAQQQSQAGSEDFDAGAVLASWARAVLDGAEDGQAVPTAGATTFLVHCPSCGECSSPHHEVDEAMARRALDDTLVVDLVQDAQSARVVDQLMGKEPGTTKPSADLRSSVPPIVRKGTWLRDGMQCRAPGCRCRGWLQLHHVQHVVDWGDNTTRNLVWLCSSHHAMHHEGRLGIEGDADGSLTFTFPDGRRVASLPRSPNATRRLRTR